MISIGGHVMEGCIVHTTMEITILGLDEEVTTERLFDPNTGYDELLVHPK
jgi:predicted DNA-binding protein with PD1-like motif